MTARRAGSPPLLACLESVAVLIDPVPAACASRDSGPAAGVVWSVMRPSRMKMTRSAQAASCASWVTTIAVIPVSVQALCSSRMMASPLAESSAPDGSSASRILRSPIIARAMATRCRSPPDS